MNSGRSAFRVLCGLAALAALALIGSNVTVILLRGAKSLPEALTQPETLFALGTSLKTASISTVLCFVLAVPTAYLLTRTEFSGRAAVEMLLELTMSLPYIVLGVSLLILFSSPAGKALKAAGRKEKSYQQRRGKEKVHQAGCHTHRPFPKKAVACGQPLYEPPENIDIYKYV